MDTLQLKITDVARSGPGVAREENGRVIFVPFTAAGDVARVRITREEKRFAEAELVELIEASPNRASPPCPVFGRCGGCLWQHLPYETQWKSKLSGVLHSLTRVGLTSSVPVREFPAQRAFGYRNRVQLRGDGENLGYFARGTHELVPASGCPIAHAAINSAWEKTRVEGAKLAKSRGGREYKVELEVLPSGEVRKSWNAPHAARGFRQVNDEQNAQLAGWVASVLPEGRVLYDLFGGSGNLSRGLAPRMLQVECVDVKTTDETIAKMRFHTSPVLPWLRRESKKVSATTAANAIVDPPREGLGSDCTEIASCLKQLGVQSLAAVGCDADAWARDLKRLTEHGWKIQELAVFDFFPQTPHVESAALLART